MWETCSNNSADQFYATCCPRIFQFPTTICNKFPEGVSLGDRNGKLDIENLSFCSFVLALIFNKGLKTL